MNPNHRLQRPDPLVTAIHPPLTIPPPFCLSIVPALGVVQSSRRFFLQFLQKTLAIRLIILATICSPALAGTLDNAPFRIAPPDADWKLDDSKTQPMGKDVFLAASLINEKSQLKSVVITGPVKPSAKALDQICEGIRASFTNPAVKKLSDAETTFLGFKARAFVYEVTQAGVTTYNEARVFIVGDVSWVLSFSGPRLQKDAIQQMMGFYRPKSD